MQFLNLLWHDSEAGGYMDVLPVQLLQTRGKTSEAEHLCLGPKGGQYNARFRLQVYEGTADLDYEAFPDINRAQGMALGVLRLHFANRDHTLLRIVEWKDEGQEEFNKADVTWGPVSEEFPTPDAIFTSEEETEAFFAWMDSNPKGFVLNWPRNGVTERVKVSYHRSRGCGILSKRSFPNHAWHKVCDKNLELLIHWAESQASSVDSPSVHPCINCFKSGIPAFSLSPLPTTEIADLAVDDEPPDRVESKVLRIIRDTVLARKIKARHDMICQLCQAVIDLPSGGRYAEAHHLRPLGGEHKGHDEAENIMCVCPTCHAKLDYGVVPLSRADIREIPGHRIADQYIQYHNEKVYRESVNAGPQDASATPSP